jgi:hypothetical protein
MTDERGVAGPLEKALREWAKASPRTPAADAARRVRERIRAGGPRPSRTRVGWQVVAIASALVVAVAAATMLWRGPGSPPGASRASGAPPVLPENVVVFWLDAETPVYFVVGPAGDAPGGTP